MQTIEREAWRTHFVPNTDTTTTTDYTPDEEGVIDRRGPLAPVRGLKVVVRRRSAGAYVRKDFGGKWRRIVSTVFLAIAGERAFASAMSQTQVPGALLGGALAAGTAYLQERAARGTGADRHFGTSKRSLFGFYAAIGFGLGLGAMLVNRRRG